MSRIRFYILLTIAAIIAMQSCTQRQAGSYASRMGNCAPGYNFCQYACGGWIESLPAKPQYPQYGQIEILKEQTQEKVISLIAEQPGNGSQSHDRQLVSLFYKMCMDSARLNAQGARPLRPYLQDIEQASDKSGLQAAMARAYRMGATGLLFSIAISADVTGSRQNIVNISQGGMMLKGAKYYTDTSEACISIRQAYASYLVSLFRLSGYSTSQAISKCRQVLRVETEIAKASLPPEEIRNNQDNFSHKTRMDSMEVLYPGLGWKQYFADLGYKEMEFVNVKTPYQIEKAARIFGQDSIEALKSYVQAKVIMNASKYLSDDFLYENHILNQLLYGEEEDLPRQLKAASSVNQLLGMAVGKLYVEKYFPEESKAMFSDITENIISAFRNRIKNNSWLQGQTKEKAIEKLDSMTVLIAYPDRWRDFGGLSIDTLQPLLCNYFKIKEFNFDYRVAQCSMIADKTEWSVPPQTVNGFYNVENNTITFPAGILQPPFFDPKADAASNYGGIGCVIGHELVHGFDMAGRLHDKDGNLRNWWTPEDRDEFMKRAQAVSDYFSKMEAAPGLMINGKFTLSENIADNGGIMSAFDAMEAATRGSQTRDSEGFTPQQRFFMQYAFVMAGKVSGNMTAYSVDSDEHSPMEARVNGQLPHHDSWYKAFGIDSTARMYVAPGERFDLW